MKKVLAVSVLAGALTLGGCAQLGQFLSNVGTVAGDIAADLPGACSALNGALGTVAGLPSLTPAQSAQLVSDQQTYGAYCNVAVADVNTALSLVNAAIAAEQAIAAAQVQ